MHKHFEIVLTATRYKNAFLTFRQTCQKINTNSAAQLFLRQSEASWYELYKFSKAKKLPKIR